MNDQAFKTLFTAHKTDIPDEGFTERVVRHLPERRTIFERRNILVHLVMIGSIMLGFVLMFLQGFEPIIEQLYSLIIAIKASEMPSASAILTYLMMLVVMSTVGFSVALVGGGN